MTSTHPSAEITVSYSAKPDELLKRVERGHWACLILFRVFVVGLLLILTISIFAFLYSLLFGCCWVFSIPSCCCSYYKYISSYGCCQPLFSALRFWSHSCHHCNLHCRSACGWGCWRICSGWCGLHAEQCGLVHCCFDSDVVNLRLEHSRMIGFFGEGSPLRTPNCLIALLSNHASGLYKSGLISVSTCPLCSLVDETAQHIFWECTLYMLEWLSSNFF